MKHILLIALLLLPITAHAQSAAFFKDTMNSHAAEYGDFPVMVGVKDDGYTWLIIEPQQAFYHMTRAQKKAHMNMYCMNKYDPRWKRKDIPTAYRVSFGTQAGLLAIECVRPF